MRTRVYIVCLMLSVVANTFAQQKQIIPVEQDEMWWGAFTNKGELMPLSENSVKFDLSETNDWNQSVPLLISNGGRYIWSDDPFAFQFINGEIHIDAQVGTVRVVESGKSLKETFMNVAQTCFKSSGEIPNELFFTNPQYNTWIELMYNQNQEDVLNYAQNIVDNDYPTGVLMIDDNWQKQYGNYEFRPDKFPDPKGMVDKLHSMGFKVMLWIAPFVSPDSPEYRDLSSRGFLLRDAITNDVALFKWWNGFSAAYDLSNPQCFEYVTTELRRLQVEYGIDGYKLDAGDISIYNSVKFIDSNKNNSAAQHSELWAKLGSQFEFNEFRACWKMAGQPLVQRLCDKRYAWDSLPKLISDILNAGLMGYAYTCPDMIGGGEFMSFLNVESSDLDQELIVRSCQVHALMPMMQFSVAPWRVLDQQHNQICVKYAKLHEEYGEYILELAKESSKTGEPIVRHMEYEFANEGFSNCIDQFMLGDKYLIAPMITQGTKRQVMLPRGRWLADDGRVYKGGKTYNIDVPIERLPIFSRY